MYIIIKETTTKKCAYRESLVFTAGYVLSAGACRDVAPAQADTPEIIIYFQILPESILFI